MNFFKTPVTVAVFAFLLANLAFGQNARLSEPRQEKLLNGMKLLVWQQPAAEKVTVKLRVHSGAAFDTKDKMGTMALLAEILFPTEDARSFFEELEGSLEINTNYDYIQITATGKNEEVLAILETLASAVTNPQITPENLALVKQARIEKVRELEKNPSYLADRAAAQRLFGDFPYGRSIIGTAESLAKIERADLLLARDRFFTADNATLAVVGNVKSDFVYRAVRQLFGGWKKSENRVPATFRLPEAPNEEILTIAASGIEKDIFRIALRSPARNSGDYLASLILTKIFQARFSKFPNSFVRNEPYLLRGMIVSGFSQPEDSGNSSLQTGKDENKKQIQPAEFEKAKAEVLAEINQKSIDDYWLDVDTFRLKSVRDEIQKLNNLTISDVSRVFEGFQKEPYVTIVLSRTEVKAAKN